MASACIALIAFVSSDFVLSRSESFWDLARRGASGPEDAALLLEADAAAITRRTQGSGVRALVTGSSLARSNFDMHRLAANLDVPAAQVARLWLPGMSGVELGMLGPELAALAPERVFIPVSPWVLMTGLDWERTRTYSPSVAVQLFPMTQLFAARAEHLSRSLRATHVVVRRRSPLRRVLLGEHRDITALPPRRLGGSQLQARALATASPDDFRCDSVHLRGLVLLVEHLVHSGAEVTLVPAPVWGRGTAARPVVAARVEECLAAVGLGAMTLPRASGPGFEARDFDDSIHLGEEAAVRFTDWATGGDANAL